MNLLPATLDLLKRARASGVSLRDIAPDGGAVDYEWLKKFSVGKSAHPSVNRIQALHDRLVAMQRFS